MNKDKARTYIEEWNRLELAQKNLDFERSDWARRLRREYSPGALGDQQFTDWCIADLGLAKRQIDELLLRATAAEVISDRETWKRVGGFSRIKHLDEFPRQEQVAVLKDVKSTGKTIQAVVSGRGLRQEPRLSVRSHDAAVLAAFVRSLKLKSMPPQITEIVERYERERERIAEVVARQERAATEARAPRGDRGGRVVAVVERHLRERQRRA